MQLGMLQQRPLHLIHLSLQKECCWSQMKMQVLQAVIRARAAILRSQRPALRLQQRVHLCQRLAGAQVFGCGTCEMLQQKRPHYPHRHNQNVCLQLS